MPKTILITLAKNLFRTLKNEVRTGADAEFCLTVANRLSSAKEPFSWGFGGAVSHRILENIEFWEFLWPRLHTLAHIKICKLGLYFTPF